MDGVEQINPPEIQAVQLPRWILLLPPMFRQLKGYATAADLSLRLLLVAAISINFIVRYSQNPSVYTLTERKLILCSVAVLLAGFHHTSMLFYPFIRRLTVHIYFTLLLVYVSMTFERFEGYLIVKPSNKDPFFLASYYIFISILLPNVAAIIFLFMLVGVAIVGAMVLHILAGFGYDFRPWRDIRLTRMESKAEKFKREYKKLLNGYFYKHIPDLDREFVSLDEDPRLEEQSVITMRQPFSCVDFKESMERQVEKRAAGRHTLSAEEASESVDGVCSICYVPFKNGAYLIELPVCLHVFHYGCLGSWVDKNPTCPICRFDLYHYYALQAARIRTE
jgi:hypothetical protein